MTGNQIRVTGAQEIPAAVALAERYAASAAGGSDARIVPLICELLLRLLNAGCGEILVSLKALPSRHIEIRAAGKPADAAGTAPDTEAGRIGAQISGCLLEQFADHYTYRCRNGTHVYRVSAGAGGAFDLTEEIYGFYAAADPSAPHKPADVLRSVVRNHKGFFALSIFNLLLKHLAALMLPVFVANIINTVTETGAFFVRPVWMNILFPSSRWP